MMMALLRAAQRAGIPIDASAYVCQTHCAVWVGGEVVAIGPVDRLAKSGLPPDVERISLAVSTHLQFKQEVKRCLGR